MDDQQSDNNDMRTISDAPANPESSGQPPHKKQEPSHVRLRALTLAFLLIASTSAGFLGGWLGTRNEGSGADTQSQRVVLKTQGQLISDIAKEVGASVVSIETTAQTTMNFGFFGPRSTEQASAGTGIIIEKDGLIMTNRHVVPAGTTKVSVVLSDGTRFEDVSVVGRTASTDTLDIAFLKIKDTKGKNLVAAKLGDSAKTAVGDSVIAIGNALGQFQNTVTSGIISGYGRSVTAGDASGSETESLENLIQTDTAINQGNSGGPLVNLEGEVIGINTAVAGGDAQNIGFAIPINDAKGLIKSVMQKGKLERPYLGVIFIPITADLAKQYHLNVEKGAYIPSADIVGQDSVVDGAAADKAGIKEGDVISKVDGEAIDQKHSLTSLLGKHEVGDKVDLTIIRDGKERTVTVVPQAAPNQ